MDKRDITELLIPEAEWAAPDLYLYEGDDPLHLTLSGAIQYHGLSSIGGLVLGFRLIQRAVELAAGDLPVQRKGISIYTAFPGRGAQDAFEYVCRAIRDKRYCCDSTLHHPAAQPGSRGEYLFTLRLNEQSLTLAPAQGYPPASFFNADRKSHETIEAAENWRQEKISFANTLLKMTPEECIRTL